MAFENLFIRTQKSIGGIQLDAMISEGHTNTVRVTNNPVELGADITDNAVIEPKIVNVIAQVSDTPLGVAAFGQIVDLTTGLFGSATTENLTRSNAAYNAMLQIQETREPIDLQTKLKLYKNMVITSLTTSQDKDSSRIVLMAITLKEMLIVETEIIQLTPEQLQSGSPTEQGSGANKRGRQEGVTPNEATNKSVIKSVIDWVSG